MTNPQKMPQAQKQGVAMALQEKQEMATMVQQGLMKADAALS